MAEPRSDLASRRADVVPPHASRSGANRLVGLGAFLVALGGVATYVASLPLAITFVALGGAAVALGLYNRSAGVGVQLANRAHNALTTGDLAAAERWLDAAESTRQLGYVRRAIDLHRATIALRRGRLPDALARVESALARPLGLLTRMTERVHLAEATALRALVRAASGDREGAEADVAAVRASKHAGPMARARAELARAIALERAGDRAGLRAQLGEQRELLLESSLPRERAIVRAYQRLLEVSPSSVYREPAPRQPHADDGGEPEISDWVAAVAPGATPFLRKPVRARAGAPGAVEAPVSTGDPTAQRAAALRVKSGKRGAGRVLALWVLLIVMFLAVWQFLSPDGGPPPSVEAPSVSELASALVWLVPIALLATLAGLIAFQVVRGRRQSEQLLSGLRAVALGDLEGASAIFTPLTKSRMNVVAAQAHLFLAGLAERRADWQGCLGHCDLGIARVTRTEASRIASSDILTPQLLTTRALALAALGRDAESSAEIGAVGESFPSFAMLAGARHRVALMRAARRGDLAGVVRLADGVTDDLPLSLREELLTDLARLAAAPQTIGPGERERLQRELRVDTGSRHWLEVVAPDAITAAAAPPPRDVDDDDLDAVAEAVAEHEAAEGEKPAARIPGAEG